MCNFCNNPSCCGNCSACQSSILNNQSSIVPVPLCTPVCPPVQGCVDTLPTNCVIYNGGYLACINTYTGYSLNSILSNINIAICGLSATASGNCNVYASCSDPCPSSLFNKITSSTLNVTLSTNGVTECQTVDIEDKPWVFSNVLGPYNGWSFPGSPMTNPPLQFGIRNGYPIAANVTEVRFRGLLTNILNVQSYGNTLIASIPVQYAPSSPKYYSYCSSSGQLMSINIQTNGQIFLSAICTCTCSESPISGGCTLINVTVSFDHISYII